MISGETVQAVVLGFRHSSGLKLDAAEDVAGFVEYRVRKVIEEAMKIQQRCPGQQQLSALHIEYAMRRLGMEPLYGFSTGGSGSNKRHGTFSKVTVKQGGRSLILLKEEEIDLEKPNLFPIPDPPPDTTLGVHWLLVRGEVPLVEENEVEFPPQVPLDERVKFPFSRGRVATETETQDNQQQNPEKGASGGAAAASAGADRQVNRDVSRPPLPLPLPAGFDALPGSVHGRSSVVGGLGMATAVAAAAGSSSSSSAAAAAVASPVGSPFARQFTDTHFYAGAADVQRITTTGFSAVGAGFGQTERHADRDRDVANPSSSNLLLTVAGPGATTGPGQVAEQALRDNRTRHLEQLFNVPKLAPELQAVLRAVYKAVQDVRQSEEREWHPRTLAVVQSLQTFRGLQDLLPQLSAFLFREAVMLGGMKGDGVESGVARPSGDSLSYVRLLLSMLEAIIKNSYVSCAARLHQILGALLMFCVGPAARSGDVGMRASSLGPGTNESLAIRRRAAGLLGHICAQATGFGTSIPTTVPSLVAAVFQRNLGPATAVQDPHAFVGALEGLSALGSHLLRRCFWPVLPGVVTALQAEAAREERERPKGWGGGRGLQSVLLPDMHPKSEGGGVETFPVRYTQMSRDNPFQINPGPSASSGLQEWTSVLEEVELNKRQHPDKELERSFLGFHLLRFARAAVEGLRDELVTTSLQRTDVAALGALGSFYGAASVPFLLPLSLSSDGSGRREERWGQGQGGGGGIDRGDRYRRMREAAGRWRKRQKGLRTNEEDIFGLSGAEETEGGGGSSSFLSFRDSETEVDTDSLCGVCGFLGRTLTGVALLPERGDSVSVVGGGEGESEGGVVKGGWKKEEVQGLGLEPNGRMKTNMNCVVADRGVVDDFFGSESEDEEEKDDFDFDSSQQNRPDGVVPSAFGSSALPPPTGGAMSQEELRRRREERDARQQELRDAPFLNELKSVDCILTKIREGKGISVDPNLSRQIHKFSKHRKHTQGGVEQGLKETGSRGNGRGQPGDFLCHTL